MLGLSGAQILLIWIFAVGLVSGFAAWCVLRTKPSREDDEHARFPGEFPALRATSDSVGPPPEFVHTSDAVK